MKLRTLCCNKTVLRKDISRFAPLWAIYLIGGLLVMLTTLSSSTASGAARSLAGTIGGFSIINMIYAALCAQMLFGDLFQSRMCNALHAMPLRRESWFLTHIVSGLLFSLVPHAVAVGLMTFVLKEFWFIGLYWLLGMTLEYLFFFGLAVFSVFCAGNRFAQVAVYGILNFASLITYWFISTVYELMLYGVPIQEDVFADFCPVVQMSASNKLVLFEREQQDIYYYMDATWKYKGLGEGWDYLAICAVIGVALMVLALLMYRRRKLECAGNFIAVKPLEPVFAVVFTLCVGCVFAAFGQLFDGGYLVYLIVGLIVGWFVGQMLLRRTVKVFQWKNFLKLAILGAVMAASMFLTYLDPIGFVRWTPDPEEVVLVEINTGNQINTYSNNYLKLDGYEQKHTVVEAHEAAIADRDAQYHGRSRMFTIRYTMKDGRQVTRTYTIYSDSIAWTKMASLYGTPAQIMGYSDWDSFVKDVSVGIEGYSLNELCGMYNKKYGKTVNYQKIRLELLEALRKDCEVGLITHTMFEKDKMQQKFGVELEQNNVWRYVAVYTISYHTLEWFETYGDIVAMSGK